MLEPTFQATSSDYKAYICLHHVSRQLSTLHSPPLYIPSQSASCGIIHIGVFCLLMDLWPEVKMGILLSLFWQMSPILGAKCAPTFPRKMKGYLSRIYKGGHDRVLWIPPKSESYKKQGNLSQKQQETDSYADVRKAQSSSLGGRELRRSRSSRDCQRAREEALTLRTATSPGSQDGTEPSLTPSPFLFYSDAD